MKFLNVNSKFMNIVSKCADCVILALLWIVFSLPLFTLGAASSAMYYAFHKSIRQSRGYLLQNFWSSFKSNLKKVTIIWIGFLIVCIINIYGLVIINITRIEGNTPFLYVAVELIILCFLITWGLYVFAYQARFEDSIRNSIRNSAVLLIINFGWSVMLFLIWVITIAASIVAPSCCVICIALYNWSANSILERVFRKNLSDEDLEREISMDC